MPGSLRTSRRLCGSGAGCLLLGVPALAGATDRKHDQHTNCHSNPGTHCAKTRHVR